MSLKSTGPCSPSIQTASNPSGPSQSTISGVICPVNATETSPALSLAFTLFSLMDTNLTPPFSLGNIRASQRPGYGSL